MASRRTHTHVNRRSNETRFRYADWTCRRVGKLIEKKFWIHYHPDHVWKILRRIGFSVQKPIRRAKDCLL
ncbi:helix-turn-helix domain-containing protein, partial [Leptospira santarosai]|uniref:helix-turn-helix domain-containing protein n=1 Tax=Leptospira santarosai TaxID=28183 RepID=UPI00349F4408